MSLDTIKDASFMISMSNLSSKLRIPESFGKKYGKFLAQEALLITDKEYKHCWKVKIQAIDGHFCFANGWPEFADDNKLRPLDRGVFALLQDSTFLVTIFGKGGVIKKPDAVDNRNRKRPIDCISTSEDQTPENEVKSEVYSEGESETSATGMMFERDLKPTHMKHLMIPMAFAEKTGIARRSGIILEYNGKRKQVELWRDGVGKIYVENQWRDFCKENKFRVGTPLAFEYNEPTLTVIKNQTSHL